MFHSIFEALITILNYGPWRGMVSTLIYESGEIDSKFNWGKFVSFFLFLSLLSTAYFIVMGNAVGAMSSFGAVVFLFILTPSINEDGEEYYPAWKIAMQIGIALTLLIGASIFTYSTF